jgi:hypothetical protein
MEQRPDQLILAADNWRPLLAIAEAAGGGWPARARRAVQYTGAAASGDEQSVRVSLLADIRATFRERRQDRLSSAELVESLVAIEGRQAGELSRVLDTYVKALETTEIERRLKALEEPTIHRVSE